MRKKGLIDNWKVSAAYCHAIAGLMLTEVYGMTTPTLKEPVREAIERALGYSRRTQKGESVQEIERGGWRYITDDGSISDLSVTSWYLMLYRSARTAGFDVPEGPVDAPFIHVL